MSSMTFIALGALILVAILAVVVIVASGKGSRKTASDYALRPTLSANEADFFYRLVRANGEGYVFAQVAMSALIEPATKDRKARASAFNRIARKRVNCFAWSNSMTGPTRQAATPSATRCWPAPVSRRCAGSQKASRMLPTSARNSINCAISCAAPTSARLPQTSVRPVSASPACGAVGH